MHSSRNDIDDGKGLLYLHKKMVSMMSWETNQSVDVSNSDTREYVRRIFVQERYPLGG